jgi:hypothetical protein
MILKALLFSMVSVSGARQYDRVTERTLRRNLRTDAPLFRR